MSITQETRRESHEITNRTVAGVMLAVFEVVMRLGPISAWELSEEMDKPVYQVRPRLTELEHMGRIKAVGKRFCRMTKRHEAVWDVSDKQTSFL